MDVIFLLILYFAAINLISFAVMGVDKYKARKQLFRIPEATLFIFALIGGSIGSIAGMYTFRHKTRHWYFVYGMPAILILQIMIWLVLTRVLPIQFSFL